MADTYYPPAAFHFQLTIIWPPKAKWSKTEIDGSFQEISGIDRELEVQAVPEGGENGFTHQLPRRGKHPNLVLRRGLVSEKSSLAEWAEATIGSDFSKPIQPMTLLVTLLSAQDKLIVWIFTNAYPVKWTTAGFKAMDNAIAVETLEMAYASVRREFRPKPKLKLTPNLTPKLPPKLPPKPTPGARDAARD